MIDETVECNYTNVKRPFIHMRVVFERSRVRKNAVDHLKLIAMRVFTRELKLVDLTRPFACPN